MIRFSTYSKSVSGLFRFFSLIAAVLLSSGLFAQVNTIRNKNLEISVNGNLQTRISSMYPGSKPLMPGFSYSEYLETKYYKAQDFIFSKKEKTVLHDEAGNGILWRYYGSSKVDQLEKILSIKTYDRFPDAAYFQVAYVNHGHQSIGIKKWVNHNYKLIPSTDTTRFWSFQGSSHSDRRDWIQKVNPGFSEQNFMGMNESDYGGGIPIVDLWRKDAGIAIGHTEPVAKLVSLPVDYDINLPDASIGIEYALPDTTRLAPGDTLRTMETFVSVHEKDCFHTLREYASYMETKGIHSAPSEPAAYEPIWCAWGYERNFTLKEILNTLPKVKELGIKWAGLDDGFQQAEGDWHTNKEHFPGGDAEMRAFVDSIHAQGMKAVLWWAPLAVDPDSKLLKEHRNITLKQKDGSPQYITWWDSYYMAPTATATIAETKNTVSLFLKDWDFDALKLDGQHMNACAPDYARGHNISRPEQSFENMPLLYKELFETARSIKPNAVVEFCPCGDCMNFYHMPYTNQFVASDPKNSWQVRLKGKVYKALMPTTAYFGDHVELTDGKTDFASQIGVGGVPGTKFVWPATGVRSKDKNLLTPEKEILFKKYLGIYKDKMLSQGNYLGDLYDLGYDYPEAHCIEKDGIMYYAFYNPRYKGDIELRGLVAGQRYQVTDYFNQTVLGTINGSKPNLPVSFDKFLLLEVKKVN
jgi:alpha-galactosidase